MNQILEERYQANYAPRVAAFVAEVGPDLNAAGIPEPHLPCFGIGYEDASPKVAIVGRDTAYWGDMPLFLRAAATDTHAVLERHEAEFNTFKFTEWTNSFGKTFWDTALRLLAGFHGISDWRELKRREHPEILRGFLWAEVNAVELYGSSSHDSGADFTVWQTLKTASERHLDSISLLLDTFRPDVVVVLSRYAPAGYWAGNCVGNRFATACSARGMRPAAAP